MSKQDEENSEKQLEKKTENNEGEESQGEENAEASNPEENSEKKPNVRIVTVTRVEAPKTRLITAFVMLLGSLFVALYTYLQHYEIGDWLLILFISLVIFLILGLCLEWLITHFNNLVLDRDNAIKAQEEAIAAREADERAAQEAAAAAEAERQAALLAEAEARAEAEAAAAAEEEGEEQTNLPDEDYEFGESDEFGSIQDASEF